MSAVREAARWLGRLVLSLYLSTLLVFAAIEISIDGGMAAVVLGAEQGVVDLDDEAYAAVRPGTQALVETFHLRDPIPVRHARWFADAARGDLGRSIRDQPVDTLMTPRLPISAQIAFAGLAVALVLGVAVLVRRGVGGLFDGGLRFADRRARARHLRAQTTSAHTTSAQTTSAQTTSSSA